MTPAILAELHASRSFNPDEAFDAEPSGPDPDAVMAAINARVSKLDLPRNANQFVLYADNARAETLAAALEAGCADEDATRAANAAWRCCLPLLTTRQTIRAYISCIARGLACHWVTPEESRSMLYAAQTALASTRKERP